MLVTTGGRTCAIPVAAVVETLRPLPVERLPGLPPYVLGLAVVRGASTLVVDLGALLGADRATDAPRWVTVRDGDDSAVALAVDAVLGVARLDAAALRDLAPLAATADTAHVAAVGARDARLLEVLEAARVIPDEVRARVLEARPRA